MNPLVSIVMPSYNSNYLIEEAIKSIQSQTYEDWELIIVDDSSTDSSPQTIAHYTKKDKRITLIINKKNIGAAKSRNKGIKQSKGKYIAFLDSDDIWFPTKLEKQLSFMKKNNIFICHSAYNTIDENNNTVGFFPIKKKITYIDLLKTSGIGTLTMIYDTKNLGKYYFEDIGHEDYLYKLNILKCIPYATGLSEPLAGYRIMKKSLSSNKFQAATWQWRIYRNEENLSFFKSVYYFLHYAYAGLTKYKKL